VRATLAPLARAKLLAIFQMLSPGLSFSTLYAGSAG
jgi:hypothetical protein